jgi:DNA-binding NarL/FixJ family response regulator
MSILIAEDTSFQREYLRNLITAQMPRELPIIEAEDGVSAVEAALRTRPALVVLDIKLPKLNGIRAAKAVWEQLPLTRIVFWSQYKDEAYLRELGKIVPPETVYGYVLKNSTDDKLMQALRAVLMDEQCWIDRDVRGIQTRAGSREAGLTDVEYEALIDMSLGLTDKAIARRRYLSERGVQNRLRELYSKLQVDIEQSTDPKWGNTYNPRGRAMLTALKRGLINADELAAEDEKLQHWLAVEGGFKNKNEK